MIRNEFVIDLAKMNDVNHPDTEVLDDASEQPKSHGEIPLSVISLIDQGMNPDNFTAECLLSTVDHYKMTKRKLLTLETMQQKLLEKAAVLYPREHAAYMSMRQTRNTNVARQQQQP